jgi:hypothetical protein
VRTGERESGNFREGMRAKRNRFTIFRFSDFPISRSPGLSIFRSPALPAFHAAGIYFS